MSRLLSYFGYLVVGLIATVAVACSAAEDPTVPAERAPTASPTQTATVAPIPTGTPEPTVSPTRAATVAPAPTATQEPTVSPTQAAAAAPTLTKTPEPTPTHAPTPTAAYDSSENMFRLFSGWDHNPDDSLEAVSLAIANNDKSMVPLMIEMLRFFDDLDVLIETRSALSVITGREQIHASGAWNNWMEWLGKNADEYRPPDGYVQWKSMLMSLIDPRLGEFLAPAAQGSRINVFEIAWGGVRPDGIPDLQNAPVVSAGEQDYLHPSDRVFGVSINGEHRAYPLRIVNAHEMANDVLGGEPIALAY